MKSRLFVPLVVFGFVIYFLLGGLAVGADGEGNAVSPVSTSTTSIVSVNSDGEQFNYFTSFSPAISGDGRFVVFLSGYDPDWWSDLYLRDTLSNTTKRINSDAYYAPDITSDGRYVSFTSRDEIVPEDEDEHWSDAYRYDMVMEEWILVSNAFYSSVAGVYHTSISEDGRYIAYTAIELNIDDETLVYYYDVQTGQTIKFGSSFEGETLDVKDTAISGNGQYAAIEAHPVSSGSNYDYDIFYYSVQTDELIRISRNISGEAGNDDSRAPAISADGRYVVFESKADNLVTGDNNGYADIFVYDVQTEQIELISNSSIGLLGNRDSTQPSISADGRYVAFRSRSTTFDNDDGSSNTDIFVHDRQTGQTMLISKSTEGVLSNGWSGMPAISDDGKHVAFESSADNLIANDTNSETDVFIRKDINMGDVYGIAGEIIDVDGNPVEGVRLLMDSGSGYAETLGTGRYGLTNLVTGTYTITPTREGFFFTPESVTITLPPSDVEVNFTALNECCVIAGQVTDSEGEPVEGVVVSAETKSTQTDAYGNYRFVNLYEGEYRITPIKGGCEFSPPFAYPVNVPPPLTTQHFTLMDNCIVPTAIQTGLVQQVTTGAPLFSIALLVMLGVGFIVYGAIHISKCEK